MTTYLEASVLVAAFVSDVHTEDARAVLRAAGGVVTSDWALAEYSSAISRLARMRRFTADERNSAEILLDQWVMSAALRVPVLDDDFKDARAMLRKTQTALRAPDALHLAISRRIGADIASFDATMLEAATELGIATCSF